MIFFDCYDILRNSCNGRCQGCSDCPIVVSAIEGLKFPTRLRIISYLIEGFIWEWKWKRIIKKVLKEHPNILKDLYK